MQEDTDVIPLEQLISDGSEYISTSKPTSIIRSASAIVSMIASSILIWMTLRSYVRLSSTYHRLLLGMCITDLLYSLSLALFNSPSPSDVDYMVWNARGNQATCSAQGFIVLVGAVSVLLYTCSLNLYYLAAVKYNKSDTYIRTKIEPFLHGVPIVLALIPSIILLASHNLNDRGGTCYWPVYDPPHCIGYEDGQIREGFEIPCGRGRDGAVVFFYIVFFVIIFAVPIIIIISLGMIYRGVLQQEQRMSMYGAAALNHNSTQQSSISDNGRLNSSWTGRLKRSFRGESSTKSNQEGHSQSRDVLNRALAYSIAYFLTWSFPIIRISFSFAGLEWPMSIQYLNAIFNPLQGFFNFLIFMHPKVMSAKRSKKENLTWCQAFAKAFWSKGIGGKKNTSHNLPDSSRNNRGQPESRTHPKTHEAEEEKTEIQPPEIMP